MATKQKQRDQDRKGRAERNTKTPRAHPSRIIEANRAKEIIEAVAAQSNPLARSPDLDLVDAHTSQAGRTLAHVSQKIMGEPTDPNQPIIGAIPVIDLAHPPPAVEAAEVLDTVPMDTAPRTLTRAERRVEALNLRIVGYGYDEIAANLKVNIHTVYKDVQDSLRYLSKFERVLAEGVRELELRRLDWLLTNTRMGVERGDTYAMAIALKISERRAKLLGLDQIEPQDPSSHRPLREVPEAELRRLAHEVFTMDAYSKEAGPDGQGPGSTNQPG